MAALGWWSMTPQPLQVLSEHLGTLATYTTFLGVDQINHRTRTLHEASDGVTTLQEIGKSRNGDTIQMLTLGAGTRHAVVIGMPHPDEPTGAIAQLQLIELLIRQPALVDALGLVWHFVPCADPDGTRLNEGWFDAPADRRTYSTRLYRPPFDEQFEWTFRRPELAQPGLPATPESAAVASVIDTLRPELVVSMHNAEAGGIYCYVTDPVPDLAVGMEATCAMSAIPAELGEAEGGELLAPGIFHLPPSTDGGPMLCSTDYAGKYGAFGLTIEPPLWVDPRADDLTPTELTAGESFRELSRSRRQLAESYTEWFTQIRADLPLDTPRGRALTTQSESLYERWPHPVGALENQPATVAYTASLQRFLDLERLRGAGQIVSFLEERRCAGENLGSRMTAVGRSAAEAVDQWADDAAPRGQRFVGLDQAPLCQMSLTVAAAHALGRH